MAMPKDLESQFIQKSLRASNPEGLNKKNKIREGYQFLREENLSFINCIIEELIHHVSSEYSVGDTKRSVLLEFTQKNQKPHRWCNSKRACSSVVGRALETRSDQTKDKISIDCFSAKQGVLRWKNKD